MLCKHTAVCLLMSFGLTCSAAENPQPNILLIYSDDQGSLDLGCYGSPDLHTPNLDKLAKEGVRFTQMYSPSAICSASRAGFLTGRFPARAGVPGNVSSTKGQPGMPTDEITIAELVKSAGYQTCHIGKWHLGYTPPTMPNSQGFEHSFGHMGGCIDNFSHFFYWSGPNRHDLWRNGKEIFRDGEFFLDLMVSEATEYLEAKRTQPFLMYWAINAPHYPMQGTSKWRQHYKNLPSPRRQYAEFVSTVDEKVGQLIDTLDRVGLRKNTLIVFQSDHGHSTEERAFWGGGNAGPYRGAKACLLEGGIRIPSIASMPGTIAENHVCEEMATGCDWFPTVAELCGIELPNRKYDGKSILPMLQNSTAKSPHDHFFWLLGKGKNAQWAVHKGRWKLLGNAKDQTDRRNVKTLPKRFLVDLHDDIGETTNVADSHPDIVSELETIANSHVSSIESD